MKMICNIKNIISTFNSLLGGLLMFLSCISFTFSLYVFSALFYSTIIKQALKSVEKLTRDTAAANSYCKKKRI